MESRKPFVRIHEQPNTSYRFRYESEKERGSISRLTGSNGSSSSPSIEIGGWTGEVQIIVSCVTHDAPYRPHPYSVLDVKAATDGNFVNKGFYSQRVLLSKDPEVIQLRNIAIVRTLNNKNEEMMHYRIKYNMDPFKTGFKDFLLKASSSVRLCFQVLLMEGNRLRFALRPVVSDVIKAKVSLIIHHVSHDRAPSYMPTLITIICNKVPKDDLEVIFFDKDDWKVAVQVEKIFRDNSFTCYTPVYKNAVSNAQVFIKLRRKDGVSSNSVDFLYTNSNTSSKTLSPSLSSEQVERTGNAANIVCSICQLSRHPSDFLYQKNDQVDSQVQNPQISQENLPKFLQMSSHINSTSSTPDYVDSKSSTSGMAYPLTVNTNSEVPGFDSFDNYQAAPERKTCDNKLVNITSEPLGINERIRQDSFCDDNIQLQLQRRHQWVTPEGPIPGFGTLEHLSPQHRSNELERQQYGENQQGFGRDCVASGSTIPGYYILPTEDTALENPSCMTELSNSSPVVQVADSSNSSIFGCKSDTVKMVAEFESTMMSVFEKNTYDDISMDNFSTMDLS